MKDVLFGMFKLILFCYVKLISWAKLLVIQVSQNFNHVNKQNVSFIWNGLMIENQTIS